MIDLNTQYLGLNLKNPVIAGSCGLTSSIEGLIDCEKNGAGAVVIKSLFEEEILFEMKEKLGQMVSAGPLYPEIFDLFDISTVEDSVTKYLNLIYDAKKSISIPVIASINCVTANEWPVFGKRIQEAGADALELNVFIIPSDFNRDTQEIEKTYFDIIDHIKKEITIPIALKISYYFSNLAQMIQKLSESGIDGLVLFNRFFSPDIDINNFRVIPSFIYSDSSDISIPLRWIAIMAERAKCDLCASTGIHDGEGAIKLLLAGATAVQTASTLYKNGVHRIQKMLEEIQDWMKTNDYEKISQFRGIMSQKRSSDPAAFERMQFMKHFAGK